MCFAWFKFNELQKNAKKYLAKKCDFLIKKGYQEKYWSRNAEEEVTFVKDEITIVFNIENDFVYCYFKNGQNDYTNLKKLVGCFVDGFDNWSGIEKVDYLAALVEKYLDKIENKKDI